MAKDEKTIGYMTLEENPCPSVYLSNKTSAIREIKKSGCLLDVMFLAFVSSFWTVYVSYLGDQENSYT